MENNTLQHSNTSEIPISGDPWSAFRKAYPITLVEAVLWLTALTSLQLGLRWLSDNGHFGWLAGAPDIALHAMVFLAGTFILLGYWKLIRKSNLRNLGLSVGSLAEELRILLTATAGAIAVYAVAGLLFWAALHFFAEDATQAFKQHLRNSVFTDSSTFHALAVVILYPIMEEIWFRGLLYTPMRDQMGRIPAIILLSLLFAFAHGNAWPVNQFIGGLIFVIAYEKRRTLVCPILLHMAGNGVLYFFGYALLHWPSFDQWFS